MNFNPGSVKLRPVAALEFKVSVGTFQITWNDSGQIGSFDWNLKLLPFPQTAKEKVPQHILSLVNKTQNFFISGEPLGKLDLEMFDQSRWTNFQKKVFAATLEIPFGETRTYGWVAHRAGNFAATRAVGQALGANPVPILIPCHRVVSMTSLGGFMGHDDKVGADRPEIDLKKKLQQLERDYLNPSFSFLFGGGAIAEAMRGLAG